MDIFLFNLKDHKGVIAARIWSNRVPFLSFKPEEEGLEITATGKNKHSCSKI